MSPTVTSPYCAGLTVTVCTSGFGFVHFQEDPIAASGTFTWIASLDRRPPVCYEARSCIRPKLSVLHTPQIRGASPQLIAYRIVAFPTGKSQQFARITRVPQRSVTEMRDRREDGAKIWLIEHCQFEHCMISQRLNRIPVPSACVCGSCRAQWPMVPRWLVGGTGSRRHI